MKYSHVSEAVSLKKVSETATQGVFYIEGLYTGYGETLGNALRRALLSSLPGAAITQIKIKGVDHEFSTLPGMMEDIVQFILNLKKVRFHFFAEEPQVITLHAKGEIEVTAGMIQSTPLVRVVNTDCHIATLTKKSAELEMELTVEKGLGYVPAEARRAERLAVGTVILDAIFSPVLKVSTEIENMRVEDRTDYNRLKITLHTDGSISPSEALHKAGNILKDHFEKVSAVEITPAAVVEEIKEKPTKKKKK